jgi:hypothetical protein
MKTTIYIIEKENGENSRVNAMSPTDAAILALAAAVNNAESKMIKSITNYETGHKYGNINIKLEQI